MSEDRFAQKALPQRNLDMQPSCMSDYVSPDEQVVWGVRGVPAFTAEERGWEEGAIEGEILGVYDPQETIRKHFPGAEEVSLTLAEALSIVKTKQWKGVVLYDINGRIIGEWPC